ncbi:hypothetical protein A2865_04015 [Candidatus Woesebacteria bacterium RIFCSPHIGHO2_01_FULL_39_17]|uniref:PilT protein domain protein n=3 Tax=Candidatus Woeseibacteriota TaxID=1752722 RepID=A0A0G0RJ60_9BACT|nr:MAG: PilT protein domain protein [Microgenomates group bacterium GW2011_GWC1_38_12]KKQ93490.1 MAG: PilT protein domain protein [Candidatus Woesebacteria bacterium GW2011_GWB1_39_10b]KKR13652.1 MAG: PilT protein domain protein [Candidatus Woesebacteria bacterium GW2011_GWA1_39_21b]OGM23273.1 MAG: hypothetical protein A2865_04015 [Candidatus Woesebacteria bacterium RIFCSPHIGHO2_01_FULL_39_17]OGM65701.1 MAG: hypothetical protein A3A52_05235 [Candidatus Woesebacteria bacterium RIFCSPLOWO2_01_FUL
MIYFIDSNIFLRVLIQEDVQSFQICGNILAQIEGKKINAVTSDIVLAEIVWVLTSYYKRPRSEIVESIELINNMGMKTVNAFDRNIAIRLYDKYSVKYIDALIASIDPISKKKWTIISYDKDFDKLGVVWKEPMLEMTL